MKPQSSTAETRSTSSVHAFLTIRSKDRLKLEELQTELDRFDRHSASLRLPAIEESLRASQQTYRRDPTDANFEQLVETVIRTQLLRSGYGGLVYNSVEVALRQFIATKMKPFLCPIVSNALERAEASLRRITDIENQKHVELTGHNLERSAVVDAAAQPVAQLSHWLSLINETTSPIAIQDFIAALLTVANAESGDS